MDNLFASLYSGHNAEWSDQLLAGQAFRLERIVSLGHASPPDFWYDQPQDEWVLVLQGEATFRFEDELEPLPMKAGDHIRIAAHRKHRVDWTTPDEPTVWLAIHFEQ